MSGSEGLIGMALAGTATRETAAEGTTYSNVDKLSGSPTGLVCLHLGLLKHSELFAAPVDTTAGQLDGAILTVPCYSSD